MRGIIELPVSQYAFWLEYGMHTGPACGRELPERPKLRAAEQDQDMVCTRYDISREPRLDMLGERVQK